MEQITPHDVKVQVVTERIRGQQRNFDLMRGLAQMVYFPDRELANTIREPDRKGEPVFIESHGAVHISLTSEE